MNNYRYNNRKSRFKPSGDRNFRKRSINGHKNHNDFNTSSDFKHKNPGRNNQNAAKLVDKYNNLAREALSTGDKILSENYLQHADHFARILSLQEINKGNMDEKNNIIEQNFKIKTNDLKFEDKQKEINTDNKID